MHDITYLRISHFAENSSRNGTFFDKNLYGKTIVTLVCNLESIADLLNIIISINI